MVVDVDTRLDRIEAQLESLAETLGEMLALIEGLLAPSAAEAAAT